MSPDTRLMIERTVLSLALLSGSFGLLALAMTHPTAGQYFTPIVAFVGPLCGSAVQWWFRSNGISQDHADQARAATPLGATR